MINKLTILPLLAAIMAVPACRKAAVNFPGESMPAAANATNSALAYDTNGDSKADFFLLANESGRIDVLGYDTDGDEKPDDLIDLDAIDSTDARHLVIILDGVGYDLVQHFRHEGRLGMFYATSRVIAPYPTTTDVCFEDFFGYTPCPGFEALYFNHRKNKLIGGNLAYLNGDNAPYNQLLDYRASLIWDVASYLYPREVFTKEINDAKRLFDKRNSQEVLTYFVSSAGMGTKAGAQGHQFCLELVERLIHQVLWETRGLVKITLLADHGHTYTPAEAIDISGHLKGKGWRISKDLKRDNDVVYPRFGLETCASFSTRNSPKFATDLVDCEGVELVSYVAGKDVVVIAPGNSRAVISQSEGKFRYDCTSGDPLGLEEILKTVPADANGFRDRDALLWATARHTWPAPLQRLWRAHFALVENPPNVIASLANNRYSGSDSFGKSVKVESTHGGLNRENSTTFIMTTLGSMPAVMRSADIQREMSKLLGRDFPAGKK